MGDGERVSMPADEIKEELLLGIGVVTGDPGRATGISAKFRIADLLGIEINSVNYFRSLPGPPSGGVGNAADSSALSYSLRTVSDSLL